MAATDLFARRATLSRSLRLLGEFRFEQSDPARFYGALARDTADMVTDLWESTTGSPVAGRSLLDVGGGPGYFANVFNEAGLHYIGVEPDPAEMHAGPAVGGTATYVRASGWRCRSPTAAWTSACPPMSPSTSDPWLLGREMLRVTRPGGLVVLSYTVWLGPFGGHEMGLTPLSGRGARGRPLRPQTWPSAEE